jgi:hypothetical protein
MKNFYPILYDVSVTPFGFLKPIAYGQVRHLQNVKIGPRFRRGGAQRLRTEMPACAKPRLGGAKAGTSGCGHGHVIYAFLVSIDRNLISKDNPIIPHFPHLMMRELHRLKRRY